MSLRAQKLQVDYLSLTTGNIYDEKETQDIAYYL